jgi:hypothetical protein
MAETITMADVLYVPVDDQGEPSRFAWDPEDGPGVTVDVFGDFWDARRRAAGKGRTIRALALEDLQELLRGQWSDVSGIAYRPIGDGYIKGRDEILQTVIEGVTDQ